MPEAVEEYFTTRVMLNQFYIGCINYSRLAVTYTAVKAGVPYNTLKYVDAADFETWKTADVTITVEGGVEKTINNAVLNENNFISDDGYNIFISAYRAEVDSCVDSNSQIFSRIITTPIIDLYARGKRPNYTAITEPHEVLVSGMSSPYLRAYDLNDYRTFEVTELYGRINNCVYYNTTGYSPNHSNCVIDRRDSEAGNMFYAVVNGFIGEFESMVSRQQASQSGQWSGFWPNSNTCFGVIKGTLVFCRMYTPDDIVRHMSLMPRWKAHATDAPSYGVVDGVYYPEVLPTNEFTGRLITGTRQQLLNKLRKWQYEEISEYNKYSAEDLPPYGEDDTGKRYLLTRGLDKTISVLMDKMNLQFTHTQEQDSIDNGEAVDKWIRLLMPKYTRRVEIEDLNRNFWVISQVIAAVCAKLFDEQSEIPTIMKDITNELTQLWENILYLWATLALQNQKVSNRVHTEMVPIEASRYQNFNKYDFDQDDELSEEEIMERLAFYPKKYQQNLCIIPYLRLNNYKHNYYSGIKPLGIYLYHYNTETWKKITLKNEVIDIPKSWEKKLYGIREVEEKMTYEYAAPFSQIDSMERSAQKYFYSALRIEPRFNFKLKADSLELMKDNDGFYQGGFFIYDAAREAALNDQTYFVCKKLVKISDGRLVDDDLIDNISKVDFTYRDSNTYKYSLYFGEVISKRVKCSAPVIQDGVFKIIKIGDFYPKSKLDGMSGESIKRNCFSLIPEEMETTGENAGYDWATYGIGSYHINNANWGGKTPVGHDDVVRYVDYNHFYDTSRQFFYSNLDDLTPDMITEFGRQYIYNLRTYPEPGTGEFLLSEDERSKPAIYATRIGVAYWTGSSGSVWNSGLIADLFFAYKDGDVQMVKPIGKVYMFDGYWTNSSGANGVFTRKNGSRYRRLSLKCDSLSIRNDEYIMTGGKLIWYDHNKDIDNISQPLETRPRADMVLIKNGSNYGIEFSNFENPIENPSDNTLEMAIRINIPESGSVFTSNTTDKYYKGLITSNNEAKSLYQNGFIDGTWHSGRVEFTPANDGGYFYLRES